MTRGIGVPDQIPLGCGQPRRQVRCKVSSAASFSQRVRNAAEGRVRPQGDNSVQRGSLERRAKEIREFSDMEFS